jgi:hypothetical protein
MSTLHAMIGLIVLRIILSMILFAVVLYIAIKALAIVFSVLWVLAPYLLIGYVMYVLTWNKVR